MESKSYQEIGIFETSNTSPTGFYYENNAQILFSLTIIMTFLIIVVVIVGRIKKRYNNCIAVLFSVVTIISIIISSIGLIKSKNYYCKCMHPEGAIWLWIAIIIDIIIGIILFKKSFFQNKNK